MVKCMTLDYFCPQILVDMDGRSTLQLFPKFRILYIQIKHIRDKNGIHIKVRRCKKNIPFDFDVEDK